MVFLFIVGAVAPIPPKNNPPDCFSNGGPPRNVGFFLMFSNEKNPRNVGFFYFLGFIP